MLYRTVQEVLGKLESARLRLSDSREKPHGELQASPPIRGSAPPGSRRGWPNFASFIPTSTVVVILTDDELDLSMREADVALRLREPTQGDLIRRKLFPCPLFGLCVAGLSQRFGQPQTPADLDAHRILAFGVTGPAYLNNLNLLLYAGASKKPREPAISINNLFAMLQAIERGAGIGVLPDYVVDETRR